MRKRFSRKTNQLCEQASQALELALCSARDEALQTLSVVEVCPEPDASRLRVVLVATEPVDDLRERLQAASGWLRSEVAEAINRRRAPVLAFELL